MINFFYPLFIPFSFIFPRDRKIWVFGCQKGYLDNSRYFFEYSSLQNDFKCYWLANNQKELELVKSFGFHSVLKNSYAGNWLSSRANITYISHGFGDVNRLLALNSFVINFWHGTPIKKILLDSNFDMQKLGKNSFSMYFTRFLMKMLNGKIDYYYASNSLDREYVTKALGIDIVKSIAFGSPRYDWIKSNKCNPSLECYKKKGVKVIMYAPTWREGAIWSDNFKIDKSTLIKLNSVLKTLNSVLIIKPHPLTKDNEIMSLGLNESDNIIYTSNLGCGDINEIYGSVDLLITDVSSSIFDFLIFNRPIIIFMPDVNEYITGDRGVYDYFINVLVENSVLSWSDLIEHLKVGSSYKSPFLEDLALEVSSYENVNALIYNDIIDKYYNE